MRLRTVLAALTALAAVVAVGASGCANPFGRQYEYEEQYYLDTNGAVTVTIDASVPALAALRGLPLDPAPNARTDRAQVRKLYEDAGCSVVRVSEPWRRSGRRFVQLSLQASDARELAKCGPLAWSVFSGLMPETDEAGDKRLHYHQEVGAPAGGDPGKVNWDGKEVVAVKLHLPSRILDHNARRLEVDEPSRLERGNILTWEQWLVDRRAGKPIVIDVKMEPESILYRTLWLFACAFAAAVSVMAVIIVWVMRKGRKSRNRRQPA